MALPEAHTHDIRDERCLCGNLVAKLSPAGVEIRCRRCKRIHRVPWLQVQWEAPMRQPQP